MMQGVNTWQAAQPRACKTDLGVGIGEPAGRQVERLSQGDGGANPEQNLEQGQQRTRCQGEHSSTEHNTWCDAFCTGISL